jgi:hypothetical protein
MPRALLMSLLSHQYLVLKSQGFRERYPHAWLVWEPGAWNVPEQGEELGATRLPEGDMVDCLPTTDDVLCFELSESKGPLHLGRAPENAIVVNDATISREHLRLERQGSRWVVQALPGAAEVLVNDAPLPAGAPLPLQDGQTLQAGDVRLTFHEPPGFEARVRRHAEWVARHAVGGSRTGAHVK